MAKLTYTQIMSRVANEGATPYQIASLVNIVLESNGFEPIRPQMMYNYDRNGMINGTKNQNAERKYTVAEVETFVTKWTEKRMTKVTQTAKAAEPQTVEDIDAEVAKLLAQKSALQGTLDA